MKICFWVTTFQADNQALAYHLAARGDDEVLVAMERPASYLSEPINDARPFRGRIVDRSQRNGRKAVERFAPDLLVVDNHLPRERLAERIFVLWHGLGWRVDDLSRMRRELQRLVGNVSQENAHFRWQAFGEWDRDYRVQHSGLAPENVVALGSPYSDWLLPGSSAGPTVDRARLQPHYSIDLSRPTVLLALTWHHGGSLSHWGNEAELLTRLMNHLATRGANLLIRMHDRHRYEAGYLRMLEEVVQRRPHVQLKFKSSAPDSYCDLRLSDSMISNYSSILNAFYYTEKPSLHIDPADPGGCASYYREWKWGRLRKKVLDDPSRFWKLSPDDIGGIRVRSFSSLLEGIDRALSEPDCCRERAKYFRERYVTGADGGTCERVARCLKDVFR
jgi:hypothetical protein